MIIDEEFGGAMFANAQLANMFAARKQVFVDLLKWKLDVVDGRFEVDQFDTPEARYVIVARSDGAHLASARLLRTDRAHILDSLFSNLVAGTIPTGAGIAEITRFCLDRSQSAADRRLSRNRLVSALVRHALEHRIHTYTGVAELGWLQQILAFGWRCRPLGAPRASPAGTLGALAIEIDDDTPVLLEANGIWVDENHDLMPALEAA